MSVVDPLRAKAALFGMLIADAVAMPVHWMYDVRALKADYGEIKGYVRPKETFQNSIMNLSNTGGAGRGSFDGSIIGDVINHGKKQYWVRGGNFHYHLGLAAGENTLEAQLARLLMRTLAAGSRTSAASDMASNFRSEYISFMRTPGSHNDTYASTAHRMFFANLMAGKQPEQCADQDGHNIDAIDALTLTVPVIVHFASAPTAVLHAKVREIIRVTRKTDALDHHATCLADLLSAVLKGTPLRAALDAASTSHFGNPRAVADLAAKFAMYGDPMVACYIDSSFPAFLGMAYKYADSFEAGILANANAGGENVARGSLLGAVLGAAHSWEGLPTWAVEGLVAKDTVLAEIDALLSASPAAVA